MIKFHNIALAPGYDLNLILLSQFWESGIIYHNSPTAMTLLKKSKIIAQAKKNQNLFILNLALQSQTISVKTKAMAVKK